MIEDPHALIEWWGKLWHPEALAQVRCQVYQCRARATRGTFCAHHQPEVPRHKFN